jgi:hypothetical protein
MLVQFTNSDGVVVWVESRNISYVFTIDANSCKIRMLNKDAYIRVNQPVSIVAKKINEAEALENERLIILQKPTVED